jgi:endonuclease/exonuclease/phosphatase family metal-dependent hydrolase
MPYRYFPLLGYVDGDPAWPDVAILSRHRLYDGRPLHTPDGHTFGLWAFTIVDDRRFAIAGVHLHPTSAADPRHVVETADARHRQLETIDHVWRDSGCPPLVIAGDFNQPAIGDNYALMTQHFNDTLHVLGQAGTTFGRKLLQLRIDYLLATPHWEPLRGGVIPGRASDHRPVWVDLKPAPAGASTRPTSRAASRPAAP